MEYKGITKALTLIESLALSKVEKGMTWKVARELSIDEALEQYGINRSEFASRIAKEYINKGQALTREY